MFSRRLTSCAAFVATKSIYHNNAIQTWEVQADGEVRNVQTI